jgi:hypothetical protein
MQPPLPVALLKRFRIRGMLTRPKHLTMAPAYLSMERVAWQAGI